MPPPFFILPVTEMYRFFTMAEWGESDNIYGLRLGHNIGMGNRFMTVKNFDNGTSQNRERDACLRLPRDAEKAFRMPPCVYCMSG